MGPRATEVSGEGELFGAQAYVWYHRLAQLHREGGAGLLYLPGEQPFYARFADFSVCAQPGEQGLFYTFLFVEDTQAASCGALTVYHTVSEGETLFDIAARYGADVGALLEKNPGIGAPNRLAAGTVLLISEQE